MGLSSAYLPIKFNESLQQHLTLYSLYNLLGVGVQRKDCRKKPTILLDNLIVPFKDMFVLPGTYDIILV